MRQRNLFFCVVISTFLYPLQAQYILTVNFENMDPYIGMRSEVRVIDKANAKEVGRKIYPAVESASFSVDLYVLLQGHSYDVEIYADVNNNGMYDAPPADHAWRRTINFVTMDAELNFAPDDNYSDVNIQDPYPFSTYHAIWGGRWRNLTFGSTDTIQASIQVTCDSIFAAMKTSGVFGNPDTVRFDFADMLPDSFDPASDSIVFAVPPPWIGEVYVINGDLHGDISLTGTQLQFTGTAGATQILGHYTVLIGGNPFANGFFYVRELNILNSTPELIIDGLVTDVSCGGLSDGSISVMADGGMPGYSFEWSHGDTTSTVTGLGAGDYSVTVTDAQGCSVHATYTLTEPEAISFTATGFSTICYGDCNGSAILNISGGMPPFTFLWSDGNTEMERGDLCGGTHSVTVTDQTGCTSEAMLTIPEPDTIVIDTVILIHETNGQSDGALGVEVSGGVPPFLYSLNGSAYQASDLFVNLPAGEYCVYVIDNNGCEAKSEVYAIMNISGVEDLSVRFRLYPNPASDMLSVQADATLSLDMYDPLGTLVVKKDASSTHLLDVRDIPAGLYVMCLSDGKGVACVKVVIE